VTFPTWKTGLTVFGLAVLGKGLAFIREPLVAAVMGASASSDAYYLAIGLPFIIYNLAGLPYSLWVTARLVRLQGLQNAPDVTAFARRTTWLGAVAGFTATLVVIILARHLVEFYAPGLGVLRLEQATATTRIGSLAIPALVLQAGLSGRLFAESRFRIVYIWSVIGGAVGLVGVTGLTPVYGAAGAVGAFVSASWTSAFGLLAVGLWREPSGSGTPPGIVAAPSDVGVAYRAAALQLFFQGSHLLVFAFASALPPGGLAATLFASKVQMAVYETVVLTAGVLVYPQITRFVHSLDEAKAGRAVTGALNLLFPISIGFAILLVICRSEIVSFIYERQAFDTEASRMVTSALLGYAPGIVGLAIVEILHRLVVLKGGLRGYLVISASALAINYLVCRALAPSTGVLGIALGASVGVISAGAGLVVYASMRVAGLSGRTIAVIATRAVCAAVVVVAILLPLRSRIPDPRSPLGQVMVIGVGGLLIVTLLMGILWVLGQRLHPLVEPLNNA
jgi:putative peptidoglycan lipid II flippase